MKINCPCGKEATWILLYGCEKYCHVKEEHLCRKCLYATVSYPESSTIRDHIYTALSPWTCINVDFEQNGTTFQIRCEVDRWYAKELTPDMIQFLFREHREKIHIKYPPNIFP